MLVPKQLAILLFPLLLAGCLTKECPPPGKDQPCGGDPCYYRLHVLKLVPDSSGYKVHGTPPRYKDAKYEYDFHVSKADGDKLQDAAKDPTLVYPFKHTCGEKDHLELYQGRIEHFVRP